MPATNQSVNPFWDDEPDLWDEVQLGGDKLPGLCVIDDGEIGRKLDLRKSPGTDGGRIVDKGYDLGKLKISVTIWTAEQFSAWETLLPKILPRRKLTDRQPLEIVHPAINEIGIDAVYIVKISPLKNGSVWGSKTSVIECIEFNPPSSTAKSRTRRPDMVISESEAAQAQQSQDNAMQGADDLDALFRNLTLSPSDDSKASGP